MSNTAQTTKAYRLFYFLSTNPSQRRSKKKPSRIDIAAQNRWRFHYFIKGL